MFVNGVNAIHLQHQRILRIFLLFAELICGGEDSCLDGSLVSTAAPAGGGGGMSLTLNSWTDRRSEEPVATTQAVRALKQIY